MVGLLLREKLLISYVAQLFCEVGFGFLFQKYLDPKAP